MRHSVYCLATDILDEGPGAVLDNLQRRAGVRSVTVAAKYHAVRDVYPHNPARKVATVAPGTFYRPSDEHYPDGAIRAEMSPVTGGHDVLGELCSVAADRGMGVGAWVVMLHHDEAPPASPALQVNCFGDEMAGCLCPSAPLARRFAQSVVEEVACYPVEVVRLESAHFHGASHGHHHERLLQNYGAAEMFVLGLCFCVWCCQRAESGGIDAAALAAGARRSLEEAFGGQAKGRPLDGAAVTEICGDAALAYLAVRQRTVTSMVAELVETAGRHGKRVTFIDPTVASQSYANGKLSPSLDLDAWQSGVDVPSLLTAGAGIEVTGYLKDPAELALMLEFYAGGAARSGASEDIALILRPGAPDADDVENLRDKLAMAARWGLGEVNFYNYGLYSYEVIDRVGAALG